MIRKAVVPAAGRGTRLRPLTLAIPKETLPIVDKPAIHHVINALKIAGIKEVIIVSGYKKHALMDYFSSPESDGEEANEFSGMNFLFTVQKDPIGIADSIEKARPLVGNEPFVVIFGDTIIEPMSYLKDLIDYHLELKKMDEKLVATIGVMKVEDVERWGIVKISDSPVMGKCFKVLDMIEKPKPEKAPSNWAIAGCYIFEPEIFEGIRETLKRPPGARGEYQITDSMKILLDQGYSVFCIPLDICHHDLGTLEDYVTTFVELALKDKKFGPIVRKMIEEEKL